MKENEVQVLLDKARSIVDAVRKRSGMAVLTAWIVTIVGTVAVPMVPQRYEAKARLYVDAQSVLKPMMAGLAYQPDIDRHVRALASTAITIPNLTRLMERPELGLAVATQAQREQTLAALLRRITLTPEEPGSLYTISYRDTSPERARRVVEATAQLLKDLSAGDKHRDAKEANEFIAEQIRTYEAKLLEAERKLKEFKIKHFGTAGGSKEDYVSRVSTMSEELRNLRAQLRSAEEVRTVYRAELAREDAQTPVEVELAAQKKLLNELLRRFGDAHPDVVSMRELIARLEGERLKQRQAGVGAASTSPVYLRIRSSLAETEAQVASLRARIDAIQRRLTEAQAVSDKAPTLEAELAQLTLDHDVIRKNYDQLIARRESALMGVKLDESRHADLRIVEPPIASSSPAFPSHMALALITIAAAIIAAIAVPSVMNAIRPTFDDGKSLSAFTGRPVIGVVALMPDIKSAGVRLQTPALGAAVALFLFQLGWLSWLQT